jgi:pseudouridine-5'-phosphate glycosidase
VAAGAKAILDLEKTYEVLETLGVPVITVGQDMLPAFWSAVSDIATPLRMDTAAQIASAQITRTAMGLSGGQLICNPIPIDAQIPADVLAPVIAQALSEADAQSISAKLVTPFLLGRIFELTEGRSLVANIALVRNNAVLATKIAGEMVKQSG